MIRRKLPPIVGTRGIARMLGVSRQRVLQLAATNGFPKPAAQIERTLIWIKADVDDWMREQGRGQ